jgi:hypothetical protein
MQPHAVFLLFLDQGRAEEYKRLLRQAIADLRK